MVATLTLQESLSMALFSKVPGKNLNRHGLSYVFTAKQLPLARQCDPAVAICIIMVSCFCFFFLQTGNHNDINHITLKRVRGSYPLKSDHKPREPSVGAL